MQCTEERTFTADYHDPEKRSIANSLTLDFSDGTTLTETVEYPLVTVAAEARAFHYWRRSSATNLARRFAPQSSKQSWKLRSTSRRSSAMPVQAYVDLYATAELDRT